MQRSQRQFHRTREFDLRHRQFYGICMDFIFPDDCFQHTLTKDLKWWREDAREEYQLRLRKQAK